MTLVRNALAALLRSLPPFTRKERLGRRIMHRLTDFTRDSDCLVTFRMRDGSTMQADLRSNAEWRSYWTGTYEPETMCVLRALLAPGCTVLDVGANVGFYSVGLGRILQKSGGKLFAIEPLANNFARLEQMIRRNRLGDVITPLSVALGNSEGTFAMHWEDEDGATTGNAMLLTANSQRTANATVRMTRLDTLVEEQQIASCRLIKVDIEGAELDFLRGGERFLRVHHPTICMEFNAGCMREFGHTFADIAEFARTLGYRIVRDPLATAPPEVAAWSYELENLYLIPR